MTGRGPAPAPAWRVRISRHGGRRAALVIACRAECGSRRLDELGERWKCEAAEREQAEVDGCDLTDAERQQVLRELHEDPDWGDQPPPAWRRGSARPVAAGGGVAPGRAMSGAERLAAFHRLPEAEQAAFWRSLRCAVEAREASLRREVVA